MVAVYFTVKSTDIFYSVSVVIRLKKRESFKKEREKKEKKEKVTTPIAQILLALKIRSKNSHNETLIVIITEQRPVVLLSRNSRKKQINNAMYTYTARL